MATASAHAARTDLVDFLGRFKSVKGWAMAIAAVNVVGIVYGFYYYREQFAVTPMWLWPLVPDSPLAVLWAELALVAFWLHRSTGGGKVSRWHDALDGLAFVGNAQVGLWTVYVLVAYAESFGTYTLNLNTILLAGHAAMVALGSLFLSGLRSRVARDPPRLLVALGAPAAYYLVNDAVDYFGPDFVGRGCGLRPMTVPCDAALEPALTWVTFGLTLFTLVGLYLVIRPRATE